MTASIQTANMTSKATQRVYPAYVPPPITVVVQEPQQSDFQKNVTEAADIRFAQAINDFAADFTQAVTLSFAKLPTTIQDLDETAEDSFKVTKPTTHDRLSLAEMGLSGYKTQKDATTTRRPAPVSDHAILYQV